MIQTGLIPNAHSDLITDASYDFYGLRLATCSLDQRCVEFEASQFFTASPECFHRIKIWETDESNNWNVEDDWKVRAAIDPMRGFYSNRI